MLLGSLITAAPSRCLVIVVQFTDAGIREMKKGGHFIASRLIQRKKSRSCITSESWCRYLSSLQGAVEKRCQGSSAREASWEQFLGLPPQLWDNKSNKKSWKFTDFIKCTPGNNVWLDTQQWIDETRQPTTTLGACRTSFHQGWLHGAECEDPGRTLAKPDSHVQAWRRLSAHGHLSEAIDALDLLVQHGSYVPRTLFYDFLKKCIAQKDLVLGRRVHGLTARSGYESNKFLANHIIRMYASHGRLEEATKVFTSMALPDTFMWCSLIKAHAEHGQPMQAIKLYQRMRELFVKPDSYVFVAVLKACASAMDLASGRAVHADIVHSMDELDMLVGNSLIVMYAKCGSLLDAHRVFDNLPKSNVATWNAMITGYARHGLSQEVFALYASMQQDGMNLANEITFVCLLQACARGRSLHQGKQLDAQIHERGLDANVVIGNCLVDMYAKCGSLDDARRVFDRLPSKDVVTWTTMLTGYTNIGMGQEALHVYANMQQEGTTAPDHFTFSCLLKACAGIKALHEGKQLHAQIQERGLEADVVVGSCLVDLYAKCGSLEDAQTVFDNLPTKNVVTWNVMIAGYVQHGLSQEALSLYAKMQQDAATVADHATYVSLLQACGSMGSLHDAMQLHGKIKERGLENDLVIANGLLDMYVKCGGLNNARLLFDKLPTRNVVTWTAMIVGYARHGVGQEALNLYASMEQEGITPANHFTFSCLLKACSSVGALHQGKQLHLQILARELLGNVIVGNCLVDMYAKCGSLEDARTVFDGLPTKNVVTWNALLNGYAQNSDGQRAVQCYKEMRLHDVEPNDATFLCVLKACSHEGLVNEGQRFFKMMVEDHGIAPTACHYACMVDLFGRAGHLNEAEIVLQTMPFENDIVAWTSLLSACKSHGDTERGRRCFDRLVDLEPQNATPYLLLADIYAHARRWKDVERIDSMRKLAGASNIPATACIELRSKVHTFSVGERRDDIFSKLKSVNVLIEVEQGRVPHTDLVSDGKKEDALCGHAEKLALAYGLLNTPSGTTLIVTKNLRMCNDCHTGTKIMSRLEKREIIVRDGHCVHKFVDGWCSCGDRH